MTKINIIDITSEIQTPAFVYDENNILKNLGILSKVRDKSHCKVFFPLKTFSIADGLDLIASCVDGFSVSSLFEARLARQTLGDSKIVHITTPGFRPDEISDIAELCNYISFNSPGQLRRFYYRVKNQANCGLRINPQLSFIDDDRYNPCKKYSKLGTPLDQFCKSCQEDSEFLKKINGILFHTNCESENIKQLVKTIKHINSLRPELFTKIKWINLGGGYLFNNEEDLFPLIEIIKFLKNKHKIDIFFEPGKAVAGEAGYIVSTVLDIFNSDGKDIAVVDTTVNHMPEVFEYQYKPDITQESADGKYKYILAGATCLAGDLFGTYRFNRPLALGSRITFKAMGAYTLVKANMFNGINLPTIYAHTQNGKIELKKEFNYEYFLSKCGGGKYVAV